MSWSCNKGRNKVGRGRNKVGRGRKRPGWPGSGRKCPLCPHPQLGMHQYRYPNDANVYGYDGNCESE